MQCKMCKPGNKPKLRNMWRSSYITLVCLKDVPVFKLPVSSHSTNFATTGIFVIVFLMVGSHSPCVIVETIFIYHILLLRRNHLHWLACCHSCISFGGKPIIQTPGSPLWCSSALTDFGGLGRIANQQRRGHRFINNHTWPSDTIRASQLKIESPSMTRCTHNASLNLSGLSASQYRRLTFRASNFLSVALELS